MHFFAAFDQHVGGLLGFGVRLADDVKNLGQHRTRRAVAFEFAEVHRTIGEQHGLIRRGKSNLLVVRIARIANYMPGRGGKNQNSGQQPDDL